MPDMSTVTWVWVWVSRLKSPAELQHTVFYIFKSLCSSEETVKLLVCSCVTCVSTFLYYYYYYYYYYIITTFLIRIHVATVSLCHIFDSTACTCVRVLYRCMVRLLLMCSLSRTCVRMLYRCMVRLLLLMCSLSRTCVRVPYSVYLHARIHTHITQTGRAGGH